MVVEHLRKAREVANSQLPVQWVYIMTNLPLAARLRPQNSQSFFGQKHLLAYGKPLYPALMQGQLHSMILWGPPGTGKTTLAKLMADRANMNFTPLSAVLVGVKELRQLAEQAQTLLDAQKTPQINTLVFVDEIHRFNKAQQDALLPYVENGLFTLIGATTENPSFEINNALLSRIRIHILKKLTLDEIVFILDRALNDSDLGLGQQNFSISTTIKQKLAMMADGDARQALNLLERAAELAENRCINEKILRYLSPGQQRYFDKQGDFFHDQISALHKSVRGTDPDAALYWLARLLDGGCDPTYLARRLVRMASEDIGNSDPRALQIALDAWTTQERLGKPEGSLALAQAVIYLSCTTKSNAVYTAFKAAMEDAKAAGTLEVPLHLRNASNPLMRKLNYGKTYRYPHEEANAYVPDQSYLPKELAGRSYYTPAPRGLEIKIGVKLTELRKSKKASI